MKSNAIDRRDFLYALGASAIAASPLLTGVRRANAREGRDRYLARGFGRKLLPLSTPGPPRPSTSACLPSRNSAPRELHESLYLFDGEMETTWFGALYDNILKGGGGGVGGSFTVGAMGLESARGRTGTS